LQCHAYYGGTGTSDAATIRLLTEIQLMEDFGWTHKEIGETQYKFIQKLLLVKKQKNAIQQNQVAVDNFKKQNMSSGSGQMKRFYRDV
jgi:hypothetical protein